MADGHLATASRALEENRAANGKASVRRQCGCDRRYMRANGDPRCAEGGPALLMKAGSNSPAASTSCSQNQSEDWIGEHLVTGRPLPAEAGDKHWLRRRVHGSCSVRSDKQPRPCWLRRLRV